MKVLPTYICATIAVLMGASAHAQTADQVLLVADDISETADSNIVTATGNVEASYQGRVLKADRVIYNKSTRRVRATGNVSISDEEGAVRFADEVEINDDLNDGYAVGFSTRLPEGGVASANSAVTQPNGVSALDQAIYTACEVCEDTGTKPTWALRARRAVLNQNNDVISYRDAVFEIAGVPVFYLPYFFHPDPTAGRRSGFLAPGVGGSTRLGAFYSQPYYKVLSPSSDLTITPTVHSKVRPLLEAQYRKRFFNGDLDIEGSITFEREFDNNGNRFGTEQVRGHIFGDGDFKINNTWSWGFGVERASDDLFTLRYSIDGANSRRGLYEAQPRTFLSQLYAVGQTESFYSETSLLFFQDLRAPNPNIPQQPLTTPLIFTEKLFDAGKYGRFNLSASSAILNRDGNRSATPSINPDSRRVSVGAEWSTTRVLPGGIVVEPFADARADYYDLDPLASGTNTVFRGLASAGGKISWPLARKGKIADIILEPTVLGAWGVADANEEAIPIEDSQLFELDETRLFESNGFGNFDLYEGDGRLAVGATGRARFKGGYSLDFSAGRRWRSKTDNAFDIASNLDGSSSDYVGAISADFGSRLNVGTRVRLDSETFKINRIDARVATTLWRIRASARYFRVDEDIRTNIDQPDEGFQLNTGLRLTDHFSVNYGQLTDLTESRDIARTVGIAYQDDCSRFSIEYARSELIDRTIGPNDTIRFRFTLATIGEFGSR